MYIMKGNSMKIIALNLPRDLIENDLKDMFNSYGDVKNCTIVMDDKTGKSKGFAFLEMPNEREAEKAIEKLNETKKNKKKFVLNLQINEYTGC